MVWGVLGACFAGAALWSDSGNAIAFPAGYRQWTHVKSVLIGPASAVFASEGGFHHIYANDRAFAGLQSGRFADGSVLVYDLIASEEKDGITTEGARRRVDMMVKDRVAYPDTGGWGFERFVGDDRSHGTLSQDQKHACFACHSGRKDHDLVFSQYRK